MQPLASRPDLLKTASRTTSPGAITTLTHAHRLTIHGQCTAGGQALLALYVYKADETYDVVYALLDGTGQVADVLHEQEGILPTFFQSPGQALWVSVVPYHPDKEQEISIPVFQREAVEPTKPARPFAGDYIGTLHQQAWFIDCNTFSDKKPDKLLSIVFSNDVIKKKANIKLELPSNNRALICEGRVHLLARVQRTLVHRSLDDAGVVQAQRELPWGLYGAYQPVLLSFQSMSYVVAATREEVVLVSFDSGAQVSERTLFTGYAIYSLWQGAWLSADTVLFRFTHEHGNGWFILRGQQMVEGFVHGPEPGYKSLLSDERILFDKSPLILAGASKTVENGYALSFYPRKEGAGGSSIVYVYHGQI